MWSRWMVSLLIFLLVLLSETLAAGNYKIRAKPCAVQGYEGTCMFVWECIKSEGQHIGMCVDTFMFGSCCAHNLTDNVIVSQTVSYIPDKPIGGNKKPPPVYSNKPFTSASGMTTIQRPNGSGTLVVRPSGTHKPSYPYKPTVGAPSSTVKYPSLSQNTISDLSAEASISTGSWNTFSHTTQWQVTTQPNFITKPKPSPWDKTTPQRPKQKPTKKPILVERPTFASTEYNTRKPTTVKPKPQIFQPKPIKITSTTPKPTTTMPSPTTPKSSTTTTMTTTTTTTTTPSTTTTSSSTTTTTTPLPPPPPQPPTPPLITTSTSSTSQFPSAKVLTISAAKGLECGIPSLVARPETRIVGGKNAPFGRWPWQVSVRRTSFFGFSSTHRCGGAVLNENWIATAGHCVDDLLTTQIRIRVGEYDFSHVQEQLPYIERAVAKKVVHPKYNFFTYEYDLALVKLETPLEFAPHISPICLPATDDLLIGENATVTGWGRLSEGGTLPTVLQEVSVPIVSNDRCKTMFLRAGRHEFIPEIFLCAGHESGGQDSCQGDSGGPLQVKARNGHYFLAGIISWGIGCAEANLPGVCTRISKFVPWILENVT